MSIINHHKYRLMRVSGSGYAMGLKAIFRCDSILTIVHLLRELMSALNQYILNTDKIIKIVNIVNIFKTIKI